MIENLLLVYVVSAVLYFCWNVWRAHVGDMMTIDILTGRLKNYENRIMELQVAQSHNKSFHDESLRINNIQICELREKIKIEQSNHSNTKKDLEIKKNFINDLLCEIDALKSLNQKRKVTK